MHLSVTMHVHARGIRSYLLHAGLGFSGVYRKQLLIGHADLSSVAIKTFVATTPLSCIFILCQELRSIGQAAA